MPCQKTFQQGEGDINHPYIHLTPWLLHPATRAKSYSNDTIKLRLATASSTCQLHFLPAATNQRLPARQIHVPTIEMTLVCF